METPSNNVSELFGSTKTVCDRVRICITPKIGVATNGNKYRCVYCTLDIVGVPIGCPVNCIEKCTTNGNKHVEKECLFEFNTIGIFCTYNCAKAYAIEQVKLDPRFRHSARYLAMMLSHEQSGGINGAINIIPSPSPTMLTCYGGPLSESQYITERGKINYISSGVTTQYPMTHVVVKQ
jgi:hypothetical protein